MANIADLSVSIGADTSGLKKGTAEVSKILKKTETDANKLGGSFNALGEKIAGAVAGAATLGALISFGKAVFDVTAEFQKFEAVLTNSLGSSSKAQIALASIQEFAAKTPFSVQELTSAFVQLANRGIEPSTKTLTAMGDLASALGKPLQQVNEAILDVTNSERWNELGIKVKVNGDKISGTFRGMTVEAERSEKGALALVQAFGEMEGVAGGMAMQSATLNGQMSNLGDTWDQLLLTIGNGTSGVFYAAIDALNDMIATTTRLLKSTQQLNQETHLKKIGTEVEELADRYNLLYEDAKKYQELDETLAKASAFSQLESEFQGVIAIREKELSLIDEKIAKQEQETQKALDALKKYDAVNNQSNLLVAEGSKARLSALNKEKLGITNNIELQKAQLEALQKFNPAAKAAQEAVIGLLEAERKKLKEVQAAREAATSEGAIQGYNLQIVAINKTIERLEKLGQTYGLIAQQVDKIKQAEEKRQKATTLEEVGKYNDLIANLKEYSDILSDVSLKEYELSQMVLKPIEAKPINIQINSTEASLVLDNLNKQMALVSSEAEVFGTSFDAASAKIGLLESAIVSLLEKGFAPSDPLVQRLNDQIKELSTTFQQITIDISGMASDAFSSLAESFGQLASGAQNVDDFGKSILAAISNFVGQLGKAMIATGTASLALKQVVSNPYAAIAAGAVLVALSSATSSMLKKGPSSNLSSGPSGGGNMGMVNSYVQDNGNVIQLESKVKGSDIILVSGKQQNKNDIRT